MKKYSKRIITGVTILALVATLAFGVSYVGNVKAANEKPAGKWTFVQGGVFQTEKYEHETKWGNVYFFDKITMQGTGEALDKWDHPAEPEGHAPQASTNQTFTSQKAAKGFVMGIQKSGWDCTWGPDGANQNFCNPWGFTATTSCTIDKGHRYKVTFKAKADSSKYGYLDLSTSVDGHEMTPWDGESGNPMDPEASNPKQYFEMTATEKTYTYTFLNAVGGLDLSAQFRFGTFVVNGDGKAYGYGGLSDDISDIVTHTDEKWTGDIVVTDFTVEDLNPEMPTQEHTTEPPLYTTTKASPSPTVKPTPAPEKKLAKVKGVKVKNTKKRTIKVSWKKVKNAKKYQIKVNNKTYKASKTSKKIKNKKFKKGKKVKVKVRATRTGYKTGAWSKTVKKKLTK